MCRSISMGEPCCLFTTCFFSLAFCGLKNFVETSFDIMKFLSQKSFSISVIKCAGW